MLEGAVQVQGTEEVETEREAVDNGFPEYGGYLKIGATTPVSIRKRSGVDDTHSPINSAATSNSL
jgi:hypothetical protein